MTLTFLPVAPRTRESIGVVRPVGRSRAGGNAFAGVNSRRTRAGRGAGNLGKSGMGSVCRAGSPSRAASRAAGYCIRVAVLWCGIVSGFATSAPAHDLTPWMGRPATERHHFQGDQFRRAGDPQCVSPLAGPGESRHAVGYFVGGGAHVKGWRGEERRPSEGTWGTDYAGALIPKKIDLRWSHGRRYQGGVGSYRTDGPRLIHRP